jgi:hypothetical protein
MDVTWPNSGLLNGTAFLMGLGTGHMAYVGLPVGSRAVRDLKSLR